MPKKVKLFLKNVVKDQVSSEILALGQEVGKHSIAFICYFLYLIKYCQKEKSSGGNKQHRLLELRIRIKKNRERHDY